ncbi:MAG: chemotaxis protein MotB, partial [Pseudonocardiales bacterium]|nr:chemotaxis protein MotB [Pseudonocardiales bacterium]
MSAARSAAARRRGGHEEEHENHERWMVTYADMLTLLLVLFIVLYAISQVNTSKFSELKSSLASAFKNGQPS